MRNDTAIAQAMIAKGADVKALDGAGSSTLMWAATSEVDDVSMVEELLRRRESSTSQTKAATVSNLGF